MGKREVRTVELTAKKWKLLILLGYLFSFGAVFGFVAGLIVESEGVVLTSPVFIMGALVVILLIGIVCLLVGWIGRWWYHA